MMKTLLSVILLILFTSRSVFGVNPLPEDAMGKDYWATLDAKAQIVFLTAYRLGKGPQSDAAAWAENRVLRAQHFPELAKKISAFYADAANEKVFLSYAITISFMEIVGAPKAKIKEKVKAGRELPDAP
jgi:hypothetical protein